MAKSFDELLDFLIGRIALTGQSGTLSNDLIVITSEGEHGVVRQHLVGPKGRYKRHET